MSDVLVDTNLLIYSIDEKSEYFEKTRNFLYNSDNNVFTTSKNLSEFLSVVTRKPPNPISISKAITFVEQFNQFMNVIFPNLDSFEKFKELLIKYGTTGIRIHDIEIISIALTHGIKNFSTTNTKDFSHIEEIELVNI